MSTLWAHTGAIGRIVLNLYMDSASLAIFYKHFQGPGQRRHTIVYCHVYLYSPCVWPTHITLTLLPDLLWVFHSHPVQSRHVPTVFPHHSLRGPVQQRSVCRHGAIQLAARGNTSRDEEHLLTGTHRVLQLVAHLVSCSNYLKGSTCTCIRASLGTKGVIKVLCTVTTPAWCTCTRNTL